jgi:hypothetical protein
MTDKKAIKILKNYHNGYFGYKIDEVHEAHNFAIKALERKIWIPTSEMLPEEYDSYLVMWRRRDGEYPDRLFYEICEYDPDEDEWERIEQAGEAGAEIVAWMPLPERYEPKEKENVQ